MTTAKNREDSRCAYRSPTGRRCMNQADSGWNMCGHHCDFGRTYAKAVEIVSNRDRLDTAEGIHSMMARTVRAIAAGKIRPRDAGMLIYAGQTMLHSLAHLREEREKVFLADEKDAWRSKALADSYHDELNCEDSPQDEAPGEETEESPDAESAGTKKK